MIWNLSVWKKNYGSTPWQTVRTRTPQSECGFCIGSFTWHIKSGFVVYLACSPLFHFNLFQPRFPRWAPPCLFPLSPSGKASRSCVDLILPYLHFLCQRWRLSVKVWSLVLVDSSLLASPPSCVGKPGQCSSALVCIVSFVRIKHTPPNYHNFWMSCFSENECLYLLWF